MPATRYGLLHVTGARFNVVRTAVGPLVRVTLVLSASGQQTETAFAVRLTVPSGLSDETLAPTCAFTPRGEFPRSLPAPGSASP